MEEKSFFYTSRAPNPGERQSPMQKKWCISVPGITVGYRYEPSLSVPLNVNHCHDTYELLYVVGGVGRYIIEGRQYDMRPGTVIVVPPYAYHCVEVPLDDVYERFIVNFAPGVISGDVAELLSGSVLREGAFYSSCPAVKTLLGALERFELSPNVPEDRRKTYMRALLCEIMVLLSSVDADTDVPDNRELGARVIRYLNENVDKNLSLDHIARHFFVSKYYLCRAFKKHNGISIHGYLTQKRVMYAKQLMEAGETASGAAYRVGFGDYSAFYRAYTKIVGSSPVNVGKEEK